MIYQIAADMVVAAHLAFVLFAVLGGLLVLWRRFMVLFHFPALLWAVWIECSGGLCPLTPLENWLRRQGGMAGFQGGFIEHYIEPLLYPPGLTRTTQLLLGAVVLIINCGLYGLLFLQIRRNDRSS